MNHFPFRLGTILLVVLTLPLLSSADSGETKQKETPAFEGRMYSSILAGLRENEAKAAIKPMLKLVARQIGLPINFDIQRGSTRDDLLKFGEKIADGTYHSGMVWGLEFGWLEQKYPELKVLAVCTAGKKTSNVLRYQLLVRRKDRIADLKALKGKRLAHFKEEGLMSRVVLDDMLKSMKQEPKDHFSHSKSVATVRSAIESVLDEDTDCVFVDALAYFRLKEAIPSLTKDLAALCESEFYPDAVLIGSPDQFKKLRPGLWEQCQRVFLSIHETPEGKETAKLGGFDSFILPDNEFYTCVKKWARRCPINSLPSHK